MADFLKVGTEEHWAVAVEVMQGVAKAALIGCLLLYTALVFVRQLSAAPVHPVSDVYWGYHVSVSERNV
jgi:hypothetical protein